LFVLAVVERIFVIVATVALLVAETASGNTIARRTSTDAAAIAMLKPFVDNVLWRFVTVVHLALSASGKL